MKRKVPLISMLLTVSVFISCGESPSEPENTPTPSILTVEFTGEVRSPQHQEASLQMTTHTEGTQGQRNQTTQSECEITATWTICPDADFQSYSLYRSMLPGIAATPETAEVLVVFTNANQRTYVDDSLDWGVTYYYAVRTGNSESQYSWSNEAEIKTPGDTPTPSVLNAIAGYNEVALDWTKCPDPNFSYYTLYRSYSAGVAGDTLSATKLATFSDPDILSFNDSTLTQQTAYYALRTTNSIGALSWSNEVTAVLGNKPIMAWGWNNWGQCDVPEPNEGFVSVAGGTAHSLGLKEDGSIIAWGWNDNGQCDVPSPNSGFVAIEAGNMHSLGLKEDGSIIAWGDNTYGQCEVIPDDYVVIAAGWFHSLGLTAQFGVTRAWGNNTYGQCDVPWPNGFVAIAGGAYHSLGLNGDGSIEAWGSNEKGQCDVPSPNSGFVSVAGGWGHSLGLKEDGSIVAWGDNSEGQCDVPLPNNGFVAVAAGDFYSLGLKTDGSIVAWGDNWAGQCDVPSPNIGFATVAAGDNHVLGLK